jgi:hypothetical protein
LIRARRLCVSRGTAEPSEDLQDSNAFSLSHHRSSATATPVPDTRNTQAPSSGS